MRVAWVCLVAFAPVVFWAAGCTKDSRSSTEPADSQPARLLRIAVIPKANNHEYWKAVHAGALKAQDELSGVQIIWKGPVREDDRNDQIAVVENFINAGASGIVLAPLDDMALLTPVQHATQAGIPVVIIDSGLKARAGTDYVSYVATYNEAGGRKAAQRMGEVLSGKGKVLVLKYLSGSDSTTQRENGFLDELRSKFPGIELLPSDQYAGATTELAFAKAQNLLEKYSDVDGIFGACEPVVFGVLRALQELGKDGRVKLVGFDRSEKLTAAMANGRVHGLVLQDPINIGYLGVKTLVAHIRGEKVADHIDTGSVVATPENMHDPQIAELLSPPVGQYLKE